MGIYKITPGSPPSVDLFARVQPTPNTGPIGLAFDAAGNLYASTIGDVGWIIKIAPCTTLPCATITNTNTPPFADISSYTTDLRGLAFNAVGTLFVAGHGSNSIYEIKADGTVSVFAATGLNTPQYFAFEPGATANALPGSSLPRRLTLERPPSLLHRRSRPVERPRSRLLIQLLQARCRPESTQLTRSLLTLRRPRVTRRR